MTHFDDYYKKTKAEVHQTNLDETLDILNKYIDSNSADDILSKVSSFLDSEEIKIFMEDSLRNFVYKKIFNLAYMLYKKNKDSYLDEKKEYIELEKFIEDFKTFFEGKFVYSNKDEDDLESLAKYFFKLVLSPENSRNNKFTNKLREYAKSNNIDRCYLCGKTVEFKSNNPLTLFDSLDCNFNENSTKSNKDKKFIIEFINKKQKLHNKLNYETKDMRLFSKKELNKIKYILGTEQFNDLTHILSGDNTNSKQINLILELLTEEQLFKIRMILDKKEKEFLENQLNELNLNRLNSIFINTYHTKNNAICEIEHNFPAQWGGDLSNNNLFVACHNCNNKKGNMAFYTDVDYSNVFNNSIDITNTRGSVKNEIKIALKMKQKFRCKSCDNNLSLNIKFYILNEMNNDELDFFNLSMYCEECIERYFVNREISENENSEDIEKIKKYKKEEFIKEYCIKI